MTTNRTPTAVDRVADTYVDEWAALDPIVATYVGVAGHDAELPDFTPAWRESVSALRRIRMVMREGAIVVNPKMAG